MTIESKISLIIISRLLINAVCGLIAFAITWWLFARTRIWQPEVLFIGVPLYAASSTLLDWITSKINTRWLRGVDPNFIIERQELILSELKLYLALVLKFRFMRLVATGFFATIAFILSFYPLFTFSLIYLATFIMSLIYFEVMDIKIPKDLKGKPSDGHGFSDLNKENNPAIIGTAANSIRRHR